MKGKPRTLRAPCAQLLAGMFWLLTALAPCGLAAQVVLPDSTFQLLADRDSLTITVPLNLDSGVDAPDVRFRLRDASFGQRHERRIGLRIEVGRQDQMGTCEKRGQARVHCEEACDRPDE